MITTWTSLLITGLRGNGKTLMAVQLMDQFIKAGVPVFASNFTDLTLPGVQFLDDPREWQTLPAGSVLFVDEAQRYWRARRSGDPPPEVIAMETQRHDAVRMVMLTQQPTYLDKHVRGLFDAHIHLIRRAGLPASQQYQWERCKEEPENPATAELADKSLFAFPKEYFGTYRSAEEHHIKRKLPARLKFMVAGALLAVGMGYWAVSSLRAESIPEQQEFGGVSSEADTTPTPSSRERRAPLTREQLLVAMVPRIEGAPWSAPIYDEVNEVQDAPGLVCMIGSTCRCLTTQGTKYSIPQHKCRAIVDQGGILNPYKRPERENRGRVEGPPSTAMDAPASAPSPVGAGEADVQQASYGAFRG